MPSGHGSPHRGMTPLPSGAPKAPEPVYLCRLSDGSDVEIVRGGTGYVCCGCLIKPRNHLDPSTDFHVADDRAMQDHLFRHTVSWHRIPERIRLFFGVVEVDRSLESLVREAEKSRAMAPRPPKKPVHRRKRRGDKPLKPKPPKKYGPAPATLKKADWLGDLYDMLLEKRITKEEFLAMRDSRRKSQKSNENVDVDPNPQEDTPHDQPDDSSEHSGK